MIMNSSYTTLQMTNEYLIRGLWCYLFTVVFFIIICVVNNFSLSTFLLFLLTLSVPVLIYYKYKDTFGDHHTEEVVILVFASVIKICLYLITKFVKLQFQNELIISSIQLDFITNCILFKTCAMKLIGLIVSFFLTLILRYLIYSSESYLSLDLFLASLFIIFLNLLTQHVFMVPTQHSTLSTENGETKPVEEISKSCDIARAIDEFDIEIAIISRSENENDSFSLVKSTSKFMRNFTSYQQSTGNSSSNIENFFQIFLRSNMQMYRRLNSMNNFEKNKGSFFNENISDNLLSDLNDYLLDVKKANNIRSLPQKNLYFVKNTDGFNLRSSLPMIQKCEYYEVQFVWKTNEKNIRGDDRILLLFRSINREKYYSKQQQVFTFGNILTSSLTHELKNPINGLYGLIYSIQNEVESNKTSEMIERLIEKETACSSDIEFASFLKIVQSSGVTDGTKLYMSKLLREIDMSNNESTSEADSKIKSILLCKWLHSRNVLNMNLGKNKYLLKKTKLIVENLEIFSKIKFNLSFNSILTEVNLEFLIKKCFKLLNPIVELTKSSLATDIDQSSSTLVKGSYKYLRILIQNIILLLEKRMNKSMIDVNVLVDQVDSRTNTLELRFLLKHGSYYRSQGEEIAPADGNDIENNLEVIDIFHKNNKKLSSLMNIEYSEYFNKIDKTLLYSVKFHEFLPGKLKLMEDSFESEDNGNNMRKDSSESSERTSEMMSLHGMSVRNSKEGNETDEVKLKPVTKRAMLFSSIHTPDKNLDYMQYSGSIPESDDRSKEDYDADIEEYSESQLMNLPKFHSGVLRRDKDKDQDINATTDKIKPAHLTAPPFVKKPSKFKNTTSPDINGLTSHKCSFPHVLIVDDDNLSINYLQNTVILAEKSYEVAFNGEEAYEKFKMIININNIKCKCSKRELVILMDICMPVMNGIDSAKLIDTYIRNMEIGIKCRLYFISGNSDSQFCGILNEISICHGYFAKPVSKKEILKIIK